MHDDDDELMIVPDGGGSQAAACGAGIAGFDACGAGVGVEEFIAVFTGEDFCRADIADLLPFGRNDGAEISIFHGVSHG